MRLRKVGFKTRHLRVAQPVEINMSPLVLQTVNHAVRRNSMGPDLRGTSGKDNAVEKLLSNHHADQRSREELNGGRQPEPRLEVRTATSKAKKLKNELPTLYVSFVANAFAHA